CIPQIQKTDMDTVIEHKCTYRSSVFYNWILYRLFDHCILYPYLFCICVLYLCSIVTAEHRHTTTRYRTQSPLAARSPVAAAAEPGRHGSDLHCTPTFPPVGERSICVL